MRYWISGEPTTRKTAIISELRTDLSEVRDLAEISPIEQERKGKIVKRLEDIGGRVTKLTKSGTPDGDSELYDIYAKVHKIASSYNMGHLEPGKAENLFKALGNVPVVQESTDAETSGIG